RRSIPPFLGGLERLNPEWSAAVAEKLWFHVGRPPALAVRGRHPIPDGQPCEVSLRGTPIRGMRWGDPGADLAYLVHGWGGWWQQLGSFVPVLLERGYQVVTFDALAHGESGPGAYGRRSSSVPEMAECYQAVADRFGTPSATIAHSMGCLSVVWAQRHHDVVPERQVLVAAAATTQGMIDVFTRTVRMGARTTDLLGQRFERRIGRPLRDFDLLPLVAAERTDRGLVDALIIHDRNDAMTSAVESEALAAQWPNSELLLTEGLGHYRVLRAPETLTAVGDFVSRPSGLGAS
ncbi:MAG: alpha/beta fold hydrolase, partial [Propionibacteriaceae bacterium]|nr:alpha/beta fold hydrolase [Propionibacteriaceae bacterium]